MALVLPLLFAARNADGEEAVAKPSGRAAWTFDTRVGYAAAWETGVSHLGVGEGLAIGRTFGSGLHLELQGFLFQGASVEASNDAFAYRAHYSSTQLQAGAGWDLPLAFFVVRPSLETGFVFVDGKTTVGPSKEHDAITRFVVGPSLAALVRVWHVSFGVDAQAFFVPSTIAAPSLGVFGVAGASL
ncbi:MAG TPA: hypothetical protein VIF62_06415 [Labilithrix sp.]